MNLRLSYLSWLLFLLLSGGISHADVSLPAIIASKMMLQREMAAPIWGTANPGEEVTVTFNSQTLKTTADPDGKWNVKLAPMKPGGPYSMTISGTNTLQIENILIGDVWFCGGQSNMGVSLKSDLHASTEIPESTNPQIRLFFTFPQISEKLITNGKGEWQECIPSKSENASAVGYYFAKELQKNLNIPIGIIKCAQGSSSAESWMSPSAFKNNPELQPSLELWAKSPELSKQESIDAESSSQTSSDAEKGKNEGSTKKKLHPKTISGCYLGTLASMIPYGIRGVIWYQGEANARFGKEYSTVFPALIRDWREGWGQGDFPFLFVQLPNIEKTSAEWSELRESQLMTVKTVPNTAMATTIDVGDPNNLHPNNKKPVGERLAIAALGLVYGKPGEIMGPLYKSSSIENGKIKIIFDHIGSGLSTKEGVFKGFEIAGENKKFVPAEAAIEGESLVVWSNEIPAPLAVRYAWTNNPAYSLMNKEGLLASPFRTERW